MKKTVSQMLFFLSIICVISCSKRIDQVYIVGYDGDDAVYWLNGERNVLPKTSEYAKANSVAISRSNVYIVGYETNALFGSNKDAVYWLNGEKNVLPKTSEDSDANAIAISGKNIYIVGNDGFNAVYWLNGERYILPSENISERESFTMQFDFWEPEGENETLGIIETNNASAYANSIAIVNNNVYISGNDGDYPVYWLNGQRNVLPTTVNGKTNSIAIFGSNVYISGADYIEEYTYNVVYWLNGEKHIVSEQSFASASSITVSGSNVYLVGTNVTNALYWENGQLNILPKEYDYDAYAESITVSGSDIYICGNEALEAVYWLNGQAHFLPVTNWMSNAKSIAIIRR